MGTGNCAKFDSEHKYVIHFTIVYIYYTRNRHESKIILEIVSISMILDGNDYINMHINWLWTFV